MRTLVALLRGINVGGRARVPMPELRELLGSLGLEDVTTYIQSGNAVFRSAAAGDEALAARIEAAIEAALGLHVSVLLRTPAELARIVRGNPFLEHTTERSKLHVCFLDRPPPRAALAALDPGRGAPDQYHIDGREVFLFLPNGLGRSKLSIDWFERKLGVRATARNWNTVTKLLELAGGL